MDIWTKYWMSGSCNAHFFIVLIPNTRWVVLYLRTSERTSSWLSEIFLFIEPSNTFTFLHSFLRALKWKITVYISRAYILFILSNNYFENLWLTQLLKIAFSSKLFYLTIEFYSSNTWTSFIAIRLKYYLISLLIINLFIPFIKREVLNYKIISHQVCRLY